MFVLVVGLVVGGVELLFVVVVDDYVFVEFWVGFDLFLGQID